MGMKTYMVDSTKEWTIADYMLLEDEVRYEIIESKLFVLPTPETNHQSTSRELNFSLYVFLKEKKIGEIFNAPFDVYLSENNVVQPDLVVVGKAKQSLIEKKGLVGAPDLVVEILSPSSKLNDLYAKKDLYQKFKVLEYWIVDPANKTIEVLVLNEMGQYALHSFAAESGLVSSKFLVGYSVEISEVFNF